MTLDYNEIANWIAHDPDLKTREELTQLQEAAIAGDSAAQSDLADRFQGLLQFGTAGLRGEMGGGPFRMNRAVVRKATAGLVDWLAARVGADAVVAIGFDARYNSRDFANDVAGIVTAAGMKAIVFPRELPTPVLAYSVRKLGADAGVMITASHNPPQDNGYKLYLGGRAIDETGNGVQIVPPVDGEIAAKIAATGYADEIPVATEGWELLSEEIVESYISETAALVAQQPVRDLKIVYTAMHGVGYETMAKVFSVAGFTDVHGVPEQIHPDPDFPTVSFPNPEEAGALDLAMAYAAKIDADIIIASDPDADRASAAIPNADGTWRQLSGDEIGTVLGEVVAKTVGQTSSASDAVLASSIVSSRILGPIAQQYGLRHVATLTGFKWIARPKGIVYGYEEAIGFCVNPDSVKDKDGISAGLVIASTAAQLKAAGKSLADELDRIYSEHGVYLTGPVTIRVEDLSIIPATMEKIRTAPPVTLAGSPVASIVDLNEGTAELPPTDAVMIHTEANDRVIIRPSGTEPKVKCYLEVIVPLTDGVDLAAAKALAAQRLEQFKSDMAEALKL